MCSSMYFCCTTCFVQWVEGYLVACMSHYMLILRDRVIHVQNSTGRYWVCAIKGTTIKFCMSGSQNYLVLPTVGYPTCSDKWHPDK